MIKFAYKRACPTAHLYDYKILHSWFMWEMRNSENGHKYFSRKKPRGFDVKDFSVLPRALEEIEKQAQIEISCGRELILIEFARDYYSDVLKTFSSDFLCNAYFLFFDADIETCIKRVHERSLHPITSYDHFVSDEIMRSYYGKDNRPYMLSQFAQDYNLDNERVTIIDNTGPWVSFMQQIKAFMKGLFKQEPNLSCKTSPLSETSSGQCPSFAQDSIKIHEQKHLVSTPEPIATLT